MRCKLKIVSLTVMLFLLLGIILVPISNEDNYQAATSYTNAKEFYESTAIDGQSYHAEAANGSFYIATYSKLASTSYGLSSRARGHLMYRSLGYDITLSNDAGYEVSFSVKRNGSIDFLEKAQVNYNGYQYDLWCIPTDTLNALAKASNPSAAEKVLSSSLIHIKADAIMATVLNGEASGYIEENGKGGLYISGDVYRLKDNSKWREMMDMFSGHDFASYRNILDDLENYELSVRYNIQGTDAANTGCTSTVAVGNTKYTNSSGWLYSSGSQVMEKHVIMKEFQFLNPSVLQLSKPGYHLVSGQEWITKAGYTYSSSTSYLPTKVESEVGFKNKGITMYANWKRNEYTIEYSPNGGVGTIPSQKMSYDVKGYITYNSGVMKKAGFYLPEGAEWIDSTGKTYADGQQVVNLTSTHNGKVVLLANWQPLVVSIKTDKQGGTGGTDLFYQKYGVGFYSDKATLSPTSQISVPSKVGYKFTGYYKNIFGVGTPLIKEDGSISLNNTSYTSDATIYAGYEALKFTIMFDMQGGSGGTETAIATYDQELPYAEAPGRDGYTFKGYYTGINGTGEKYYNEYMSPDMDSNPDDTYKLLTNLTLYAYWVDESAPTVTLTADYDTWTNREIVLTVDAFDNGKGLKSVELFQGETCVEYFDGLNGTQRKSFTFNNETEGVVMYRAVATDMNDNQMECFVTVKYDKSAPKGTIVEEIIEGNKFSIVIDSWDTNPDNP